jgi:hypothetical protein
MLQLPQATSKHVNNHSEVHRLHLWLTERFVFLQFIQKRWLSVQKLKNY